MLTPETEGLQWGRDQLIAEISHFASRAFRQDVLQWGRDQLIAEMHGHVRLYSDEDMLQWGRDQLIAEMRQLRQRHRGHVHASMGPRSIDRGNFSVTTNLGAGIAQLQWGRDQLIAEILRAVRPRAPPSPLQWGRDQLIAEIVANSACVFGNIQLQWGRDQLIAEIWGCLTSHQGEYNRFNGAAIN